MYLHHKKGGFGLLLFVITSAIAFLQFILFSHQSYFQYIHDLNMYVQERQPIFSAKSCLGIALQYISENVDVIWNQSKSYSFGSLTCTIDSITNQNFGIQRIPFGKFIEISSGYLKTETIVEVEKDSLDIISTHVR